MAAHRTKSCFEKKCKINQIRGTRPSLINNQLLVSTGIPSLDSFIGGGLAVGTVLLIEEDKYASYSSMMLKLYLADACANQHEVFIASSDISPQAILNNLPCPISYDPVDVSLGAQAQPNVSKDEDQGLKKNEGGDGLHIAWRYQNLKIEKSAAKPTFGLYFDVAKCIDAEFLDNIKTTLFSCEEDCTPNLQSKKIGGSYSTLLSAISRRISDGKFATSCQNDQRNILRIGIQSVGSPLWRINENQEGNVSVNNETSLCRFLYALRSMLRTAYATCLITIPTHLFQDPKCVSRIRNLCDNVVSLESFADSNVSQDSTYKEYHGLFYILKTPRLNALSHHEVDTDDLVFKLRRKRFTIEKLHLPPSLQENADSEAVKKSQEITLDSPGGRSQSMGCNTGQGHNSKLDF